MKRVVVGLAFGLMLTMAANASAAKGDGQVIEKGRTVTFDYTLTVDGQVVDSSEGRQPLQYKHGEGKIIPGLSKRMEGLRKGDEKDIVVGSAEAYGQVDPSAFQEVPKSQMPAGLEMNVGTQLQAKSQDGRTLLVTVSQIKKDSVVLNFNHPLAGKELHFHVKIVEIQ